MHKIDFDDMTNIHSIGLLEYLEKYQNILSLAEGNAIVLEVLKRLVKKDMLISQIFPKNLLKDPILENCNYLKSFNESDEKNNA